MLQKLTAYVELAFRRRTQAIVTALESGRHPAAR